MTPRWHVSATVHVSSLTDDTGIVALPSPASFVVESDHDLAAMEPREVALLVEDQIFDEVRAVHGRGVWCLESVEVTAVTAEEE